MNKAKLKSYAPQARKDFIASVTARANLLGLSEKVGKLEVLKSEPQGDITIIAGHAWPAKVHSQRQQLIARIQKEGFVPTMEAVAYTWFNRFAALRYMELHDYLGHGFRALSSRDGTLPEILNHATSLVSNGPSDNGLPGLKPAQVAEMKLAGNRDGELYRLLLIAQCNALSNVMPFLFERIDDETELLLPDNLLRTDSVINKLVISIDEEDWENVEVIGWLYQFYISEKKDDVIGKVVKSEDIPAATQLFTPNWIVQYLVQNSVGRLWLMANTASTLQVQWPYYVAPGYQTHEAQVELDNLVQARVNEDGSSLNPESITVLDPACGSGHILVEAYEVLKAIYLERGYQPRTIPRLILEKNLYGLDIDDRAAQMAGFALLMKARADDRQLFNSPVKLNVLSLQESKRLNAREIASALQTVTDSVSPKVVNADVNSVFTSDDLFPETYPQLSLGESGFICKSNEAVQSVISMIVDLFSCAKTFGSLIRIPPALNTQLTAVEERLQVALQSGDLYVKSAAQDLWPLILQAKLLGMQFDAVVANPPYMGGKGMDQALRNYAKTAFPDSKSDLFAMFIERGFEWCKPSGLNSMVTMQNWLFLSSYEEFRDRLLGTGTVLSLVQIGYNSFPEINSKIAQACAFVYVNENIKSYKGVYINLNDAEQSSDKSIVFMNRDDSIVHESSQETFREIPGKPFAYWASEKIKKIFASQKTLGSLAEPKSGLSTTDNERFLRYWYEVPFNKIGFGLSDILQTVNSVEKWFPFSKGGDFRRWYGNQEYVVNWKDNGREIKEKTRGAAGGRIVSPEWYFKKGVTWSGISSGKPSMRILENSIFGSGGKAVFSENNYNEYLGLLNSNVALAFLDILSPTLNYEAGHIGNIPVITTKKLGDAVPKIVESLISISRDDWDMFETSWGFKRAPLIGGASTVEQDFNAFEVQCHKQVATASELERESNRLFIEAYGLQDELSPEVPDYEICLARANREKDCQRLVSYAIGCMMGRYSLDAPGLIYARSGNVGFDTSRYNRFPADADGIVPLNDEFWFEDEAASRIREFLVAVWGDETISKNMAWLAESLGIKAGETPDESVLRYLADKFYQDHLQTYRKRPIYWLFSSGKHRAFQGLVYLHRYHEGTLARMRAEYVVPLIGKVQSRIDMLEKDTVIAVSAAARNKLNKDVDKLKKKHVELLAYDEQLRHYADMRINLDLDDGVKANYGRFGDLLAEVKAVTGGNGDD